MEKFERIIEINKSLKKGVQHTVPTLVGTTGIGKTTRIRKYAEKLGLPVKTLLLGTMLEEDVNGLPQVINGVTKYSLPEWADSKEPFILFLDELDKARTSVLSTVLTLMAEHRIRDHILPEGSIIIAAMQPVQRNEFLADQTGQAIAARSCYIDLKPSWSYLENEYNVELNFMPHGEKFDLPILSSPSPRQVEWALNAVSFLLANCGDDAEKNAADVLSGMFQPQLIEPIIEAVKNNNVLSPVSIVEAWKARPELIEKATVPELINLMPTVWLNGNGEVLCKAWECMLLNGTHEEIAACMQSQYDGLLPYAEANDGKVKVLGDTTPEEDKKIELMFNETMAKVGKEWIRRNEEKNKK